jgi:hypothetical protein
MSKNNKLRKFGRKVLQFSDIATVCSKRDGFEMIIRVYPSDYDPPRAYIYDLDNNNLGCILIEDKIYNSFEDINSYKEEITGELKKKIFDWGNALHRGHKITNFNVMVFSWDILNTEE